MARKNRKSLFHRLKKSLEEAEEFASGELNMMYHIDLFVYIEESLHP